MANESPSGKRPAVTDVGGAKKSNASPTVQNLFEEQAIVSDEQVTAIEDTGEPVDTNPVQEDGEAVQETASTVDNPTAADEVSEEEKAEAEAAEDKYEGMSDEEREEAITAEREAYEAELEKYMTKPQAERARKLKDDIAEVEEELVDYRTSLESQKRIVARAKAGKPRETAYKEQEKVEKTVNRIEERLSKLTTSRAAILNAAEDKMKTAKEKEKKKAELIKAKEAKAKGGGLSDLEFDEYEPHVLTDEQRARRDEIEKEITTRWYGAKRMIGEVFDYLDIIKTEGLYQDRPGGMAQYIADVLNVSTSNGYRLITMAKVGSELWQYKALPVPPDGVDLTGFDPDTLQDRHVRELERVKGRDAGNAVLNKAKVMTLVAAHAREYEVPIDSPLIKRYVDNFLATGKFEALPKDAPKKLTADSDLTTGETDEEEDDEETEGKPLPQPVNTAPAREQVVPSLLHYSESAFTSRQFGHVYTLMGIEVVEEGRGTVTRWRTALDGEWHPEPFANSNAAKEHNEALARQHEKEYAAQLGQTTPGTDAVSEDVDDDELFEAGEEEIIVSPTVQPTDVATPQESGESATVKQYFVCYENNDGKKGRPEKYIFEGTGTFDPSTLGYHAEFEGPFDGHKAMASAYTRLNKEYNDN